MDQQKTKKSIFKKWWFWTIFVVLFLAVIVLIGSGGSGTSSPSSQLASASIDEVKAEAISDLDYDELFRNNSEYVGKVVHYVGEVVQIQEGSGNSYVMRANVTENESGFWEDDIFLSYSGDRVLENDIIEFWGEVKGVRKYDTVLGSSRSIPDIAVLHLDVLKDYTGGGTATVKNTIEVGETNEQYGFSITLDKIELTDKQTRVWLSVSNESDYKVSLYDFSAKLVQGGKQLEPEYTSNEDLKLPSEYLSGVNAEGVIVFPAVSETGSLRFVMDAPYAQDVPFELYSTMEFEEISFEVEL